MSTRAERKAKQRAIWAKQAEIDAMKRQQAEQFRRDHPILSGAVPLVDYVPPRGEYKLKAA